MTLDMEREYITIQMVRYMVETGCKTNSMVKDHIYSKMVINLKVKFTMEKSTGSVNIFTVTGIIIRESGMKT